MSKKPNIFQKVPVKAPPRNAFNLTHDVKMSTRFGSLTPVCIMETYPGDKFKIGADLLLRFAPLISPVMHQFSAYIHYFFVPNRIIWPQFEQFIYADPGAVVENVPPYIDIPVGLDWNAYPLLSHMGIPNPTNNPGADISERVSALPFAAYQKIYTDYFRDQNLVPKLNIGSPGGQITDDTIHLINGTNQDYLDELIKMRQRAYSHDYFNSCLPWAQKGAAVKIPLDIADNVPVFVAQDSLSPATTSTYWEANTIPSGYVNIDVAKGTADRPSPISDLYAETDGLQGSALIEDLRRSIVLQQFLEKSARSGTRYGEGTLAHFNVRTSDKRIQRSEYITGIRTDFMIGEVLNTSGAGDLPQANMAGHGVSMGQGHIGNYFCEEHGWIIGVLSILPRPAYFQGIPRHFKRLSSPLDYAFPEFAHIGEQPVPLSELYGFYDGNTETFGYQSRYAELKYMPNRVAGDFQTSLSFWHDAIKFGSAPALNQEFIECPSNPEHHPIFAVQDGTDYIYGQVLNKVTKVCQLPVFGVPSL